MKNNLVFEPASHSYYLDGVIIPGYSEIAKAMGIVSYFGDNTNAMNFGSAFHLATKFLDKGTLDRDNLDTPLVSLLEGYEQFKQDYLVEILQEYMENPICSFTYRFGVTPDRIALVRGELSIIEFKTNTEMPPSVKLQTAAQKLAAEEYYKIKIKKRYGIQFPLTGSYKPFPYKDKSDEYAWLNFLGAYNWLKREGLNGKRTNGT